MGGQPGLGALGGRGGRIHWAERHLAWLFWACAAVLVPWVVYLYLSQARLARAHQIRPLAVGLFIAMIAAIVATAWTYRRGWVRAVVIASFAATAAFVAAWFRTLTEAGSSLWAGATPTLLTVVAVIIVLCVLVIRSGTAAGPRIRWLPIALALAALALVPSLVVALIVVPAAQTAHHLRLAWTGFDVFEVVALASTGFALQRHPASVAVPATITGTLLLCDAWINVVPLTGVAFYEAIAMAFAELPLAALSFWVAVRAPG